MPLELSEIEMRQALGLSTVKPTPKPHIDNRGPIRSILVELSVRQRGGGKPFKFEYRSRSLSKLEAQLEAEKEARRQGLDVWAVLDVRQVER